MSSSGAFRAARQAASDSASTEAMLSITLVRSTIGRPGDQGRTVEALGLRRMHQTVVRPDHPSIRGMVAKVSHLVRVEEIANPGTSPS